MAFNALASRSLIETHIGAILGLLIEQAAQVLIGAGLARAQIAHDLQDLLGLGEVEARHAVIQDIDQEIRLERVDRIAQRLSPVCFRQ